MRTDKLNVHLFYILNVIALVVYAAVLYNLEIRVDYETMFSTLDSQSYLETANWIDGKVGSTRISTRPYLYPTFVLATMKIGGVKLLWLVQALFWFLTVNLTYFSINSLTKNKALGFVGALFLLSNISLIVHTLHALTEITVVFLLSVLVNFIVRNLGRNKELHFIHGCILILFG